jgi:hypothetical protein
MDFLSRVQLEAIAARFVERDVRVQRDDGVRYGTVRGITVGDDGAVRLVVQGADGAPWAEDPWPEDVEVF